MTPTTSNPSMELNSITQAEGSDSIRTMAEKALDDKLQAMQELKINQELDARATGVLVNQVIDGTDWAAAKYESADHCLRKKFKEIGSRRNLRRMATIATRFTDDHIRLFGTTRLDAVLKYETLTGQQVSTDNLGEQEIRLKQKDGSEVVKKVKDCSANEVIRSNTRIRKSLEAQEIKLATSQRGPRFKLLLVGAGAVMLVVAELLPSWEVAGVLSLIGTTLLIIGGNQLIRRGFNWLQSFIRSGQAIEVLAAMPSKLSALSRDGVRGVQWTWSFIRSGQIIHALAKLPSRVSSLGRAAVRGLGSLWSFIRSGQILHALAKLPSRVSSLGRAAVGGLQQLLSLRHKRTTDTASNPPSKLPSQKPGSDVSSPAVSAPPSQAPQTGDGNTKLAA